MTAMNAAKSAELLWSFRELGATAGARGGWAAGGVADVEVAADIEVVADVEVAGAVADEAAVALSEAVADEAVVGLSGLGGRGQGGVRI